MEYKINEFNNKLELREKERKRQEEYMNQKLFEEEQKRREEDIEYQIFSKMRENLQKENYNEDNNNKENENIDFNYKIVLSKGLVKNQIKMDPYKEYKEFFEMEKKKEEKRKNKNQIDPDIIIN